MHRWLPVVLILFSVGSLSARPMRIAITTGYNNPGATGFGVEFPLVEHFSADGGVGAGLWAWRAFAGLRLYSGNDSGLVWRLGAVGDSGSFGDVDYARELENESLGKVSVLLGRTMSACSSLGWAFASYDGGRLIFELGYEQKFGPEEDFTSLGRALSVPEKKMLKAEQPGGLLLSASFTYPVTI